MNDDTQVLPERTASDQRGMQTAELSNAMVRIYKEQFGRGPTKAHSVYAGPDLVVCTLEHSLTPAEHRMVKLGEHQRVRDIRTFFQHASEKEFVEHGRADNRPQRARLRQRHRHRARRVVGGLLPPPGRRRRSDQRRLGR